MRSSRLVLAILLLVMSAWTSLSQAEERNGFRDPYDRPEVETVAHADLLGEANPTGIAAVVGIYRRWIQEIDSSYGIPSKYVQLGGTVALNPAYAQLSAYADWQPALFSLFRLQYDLYPYFGTNGALLSFPSAQSKFGDREIDALKDREESAIGQRIMVQPTFRAKVGPVYLRNQTDAAYYLFDGTGPYFFEREYDTLLKNGDFLIANRTHALLEVWKGPGETILLAGPYYEVTHAADAGLTRQRVGAAVYWVPKEKIWLLKQPRFFAQAGFNVQDRNRSGQPFAMFGVGFDYDLLK